MDDDDKNDEDFVAGRPKARADFLHPVFQQKNLQWLRSLCLPLDRIALSHGKSFYLLAEFMKEGGLSLDDITLSKETIRTIRLDERSKLMASIKVKVELELVYIFVLMCSLSSKMINNDNYFFSAGELRLL